MLCWSPVAAVKVTSGGHQEEIHGKGRRNTIWNRKWQLSHKLNNTNTMQSWVCLSVNIITVYRLINTEVGGIAGEGLVLVWVSVCPVTDDTQLIGPIALNCNIVMSANEGYVGSDKSESGHPWVSHTVAISNTSDTLWRINIKSLSIKSIYAVYTALACHHCQLGLFYYRCITQPLILVLFKLK